MKLFPRIAIIVGLLFCLGFSSLSFIAGHAKSSDSSSTRSKISREVKAQMDDTAHPDKRVPVIVNLKNTEGASLQGKLMEEGVSVRGRFSSVKSIAVEMPAKKLAGLMSDESVSFIAPDRDVRLLSHLTTTTGTDNVRQAVRPDGSSYKVDGTGIGIAVLDSGIDEGHQAFNAGNRKRVVFSKDFTGKNPSKDLYGHGTHVAGEISGDLNYPQANYTGIAPGASLVNLRVLDSEGLGKTSAVLAALDWVMTNRSTYNIRIVNMSLGTAAIDSYKDDPLCIAVRKLVDAGIVVVTAAGNSGKDLAGRKVYGAIHSPGIEPSAITVGATNTFQTDRRSDDEVASFSSRGPSRSYWTDSQGAKHFDNIMKPEIVAPGNKIISAQADKNYLANTYPLLSVPISTKNNNKAMSLSGTSMAAPVVAGATALLLQENPSLTPNLIKTILMYTAQRLPNANNFEQGAGELNIDGALRLARLVRRDLSNQTAVGAPMLTAPVTSFNSTIAGEQFTWTKRAFFGTYPVSGSKLISQYQAVYGLGIVLSDGIILSNGIVLSDHNLMSDGLMMGDGILVSDGILLSDGIMISDGLILGDGVVMGDGLILGDGIMVADRYASESLLVNGDGR